MMLLMCANIILPANERRKQLSFSAVKSIKISSSWKTLTDTAEVEIPHKLYFNNKSIKDLIKNKDEIIIELGYNGNLKEEFKGVISSIDPNVPVILKCEDYMYKMKEIPFNKSYKSTNLKEIISDFLPNEYTSDVADIPLGSQKFERTTFAKVLEYLQQEYNIYSYFKGNMLVSGKEYLDDKMYVDYSFEDNIISNNLNYVEKDDVKIKVTAEAFNSNSSTLTVTVGDEDGIENKLIYTNIESKAELTKKAEEDLARLKVSGFTGNIVTFGIPYVKHGYKARLKSRYYPERDGVYYIDGENIEYNNSPAFRRTLEIGKQAANV